MGKRLLSLASQFLEGMRHKINPVHLYCRLMDCGMSQPRALRWSRRWEALYKRLGF